MRLNWKIKPEAEDIWPLTYYVQDDGRIDTVPTNKVAGYSLNENIFLVSLQGPFGQNKAYTGEMINFTAMPGEQIENGPTGTVRFKIHLARGRIRGEAEIQIDALGSRRYDGRDGHSDC